jgi:Holliday junction resolvase RusA-like endonuclease
MMLEYILHGEVVSKKNHRITLPNGKTIPSQGFRTWHEGALYQLFCQKRPKKPLDVPLRLQCVFIHGTMHRRDSDNQVTSILDLLQDAKIIKDDSWTIINRIEITNIYKKNESYCRIYISDFSNSTITYGEKKQ